MFDNLVHSHSDGDYSVHPYQSVWMSCCKRTSCKSSDQACTTSYDFKKDGHDSKSCLLVNDPELGINVSEYTRGPQQVAESRAGPQQVAESRVKNGSPTTISSCKRKKNECLDYPRLQGSTLFVKKSQIGSSSVGIAVVDGKDEGISPSLVPENGSSLMEFTSTSKALRNYPVKQGRSIDFLDNRLTVSMFFQDKFKGSASKYLPFQFLSKGLPLYPSGKDQNDQPIAILSSEEHLTKINHSSFSALFLREKTNNLLDPLENSFSMYKNKAVLLHDPSTSTNQKQDFQYDGEPKHSNCGSFESRSQSHLKAARLNKLHNECYSLPSRPFSIHDAETMRIFTTIDSVEESSRGSPKISKTTHHFLVTKKTDIDMSEEAQIFREATITTKHKGKHLSDLFDESTDFCLHNQKKANLLQSSGSSPGILKDIGTSAVFPTNEWSADTDTMDLDPFQENHCDGLASHPFNKDLYMDRKAQSYDASDLAGEFGDGHLNSDLPDINKDLPDLPIQENGANVKETSTSSTQSLDMFKNSKSTPSLDGSLGKTLNSRWIKRLSSDSATSPRNLQNQTATSGKKVVQINETIKYNSSSDSPNGNRNSQNERAASGKKVVLIKCNRSGPTIGENYANKQKIHDERKIRETLVSHPWIQRWCSNRATMSDKKLERMVICEPECRRMALNEYQGKQFPSIAAMALMGKTMNGSRPCESRKKGSYLVWNTEDL